MSDSFTITQDEMKGLAREYSLLRGLGKIAADLWNIKKTNESYGFGIIHKSYKQAR